jgi:CBS domain-containing protein
MEELTAADIMTPGVLSVSPDTPLREIARILCDRGISGVPVTDAEGRVVGIVSETDLIDENKRRSALPRMALFGVIILPERVIQQAFNEGDTLTAKDVMTKRVFTLAEEVPAREVAEEMVQRKINRIPITRDGKLVGIVTRADVLRAVQAHWHGAGATEPAPE